MTGVAAGVARSRAPVVAVTALGLAVAIVVVLHVVRDDLPPMSSRLSEYGVGTSAPAMAATFLAMAVGLVALGVAAARAGAALVWPRTTSTLLVASGVAMGATALFPTAGAGTRSELLHSATSAWATLAAVTAVATQTAAVLAPRRRSTVDPTGAVVGVVALVLAVASPFLHDTPRTGLGQRLLWLLLVVWLARLAWRLRDPPGGSAREGGSPTPTRDRR